MNPTMPRISRTRGLSSMQFALKQSVTPIQRQSFTLGHRSLSTTCVARGKNTDWLRKKLWKGQAPGPADPYTQRVVPEDTSNLPDEALDVQQQAEYSMPQELLDSRVPLPPQRTEAATETQLTSNDPTYVPATTIDGLEEIPSLDKWWEQPGNWGDESVFRGFASTEKVMDRSVTELYLRQALVEVLALQETGALSEWTTKKWRQGSISDLEMKLAAEIVVKDGIASIKGDVAAIADSVTSDVQQSEQALTITSEQAQQVLQPDNGSWKETTLNTQFKFALRKRLYQLTGKLVPDAKMGAVKTLQDLLTIASKPEQPKRLAQELELNGILDGLTNVSLHDRRITPIDKEVSVGRWKVIEAELAKRGLPTTGTGDASRNKEREWLTGKI